MRKALPRGAHSQLHACLTVRSKPEASTREVRAATLAAGSAGSVPGVLRPTVNRDHRTINLVAAAGSDAVPAIAATADALLALDGGAWGLSGA